MNACVVVIPLLFIRLRQILNEFLSTICKAVFCKNKRQIVKRGICMKLPWNHEEYRVEFLTTRGNSESRLYHALIVLL